ncbi:MAG: imidazole glycerol phosphate synthase subunit HisH [Puniceicoccales bacterium]
MKEPSSNSVKPRVAVIDYGMGNLRSVAKAFEKVGGDVSIVDRPAGEDWDAVVLPGVGALRDCVAGLRQAELDRWIADWIAADRPFFGICLGLQALFDFSEEGDVEGLGIFAGNVLRFQIDPSLKVPHMGWNSVTFSGEEGDPLQEKLQDGDQFYFDHTYHVVPDDSGLAWCSTDYGGPFVSAIRHGNCLATQFHPEKSQAKGLQIYMNFLNHAVSGS